MNSVIENDSQDILRRVDVRKLRGKKILITGASGFLGQCLAATLAHANREKELGAKIDCVGFRKAPPLLASLVRRDKKISYRRVDLSKPFQLRGYDYIFHAAGYGQPAKFIADPLSLVKINVDATANLLAGSPKATFVFFSSGAVYGDVPVKLLPVREDYNGNCDLRSPRSVYAEAKRLGETLCAAYKEKMGVDTKIVRIFHVYGPGLSSSDKRVMSEFIRKALVEKKIQLLDAGKAVKTYGYIADVVSMILYVALHGKETVYNVGGRDSISIRELAEKIGKYCKVPVAVPKVSSRLRHIGKDPAVIKLDLRRITREMKKFSFTPFSKGLARTIEWTNARLTE
ncbi:MAG: NAD-dependent epimerase/dehydratase family protein [bacterium]|nr:NAD-dependent epimerase/dehydratase family protein [bacterium]